MTRCQQAKTNKEGNAITLIGHWKPPPGVFFSQTTNQKKPPTPPQGKKSPKKKTKTENPEIQRHTFDGDKGEENITGGGAGRTDFKKK